MSQVGRMTCEFSVAWHSHHASHQDRLYAGVVDLERDIIPLELKQPLSRLNVGESYSLDFEKGKLVPAFQSRNIITFQEHSFKTHLAQLGIRPAIGRFYPQRFAPEAFNARQANLSAFRLIDQTEGKIIADINHPLSIYPLKVKAHNINLLSPINKPETMPKDIMELITQNGPGMQAPCLEKETDFFSVYPFRRDHELDDELFYETPRLVNHLDSTAIEQVKKIYARLLKPGDRILDLMSSFVSHIPEDLTNFSATGLGMNNEELKMNPQLSDSTVHNLNRQPELPFKDDQFDAVICTASVEYLTHPIEIFQEIARVTRNDGLFITTFSDRWFPGKEIRPWSELHPFERMGLVLDFFRKSKRFNDLQTESVRGLPRPADDPYFKQIKTSDPIFAVWGKVAK